MSQRAGSTNWKVAVYKHPLPLVSMADSDTVTEHCPATSRGGLDAAMKDRNEYIVVSRLVEVSDPDENDADFAWNSAENGLTVLHPVGSVCASVTPTYVVGAPSMDAIVMYEHDGAPASSAGPVSIGAVSVLFEAPPQPKRAATAAMRSVRMGNSVRPVYARRQGARAFSEGAAW